MYQYICNDFFTYINLLHSVRTSKYHGKKQREGICLKTEYHSILGKMIEFFFRNMLNNLINNIIIQLLAHEHK